MPLAYLTCRIYPDTPAFRVHPILRLCQHRRFTRLEPVVLANRILRQERVGLLHDIYDIDLLMPFMHLMISWTKHVSLFLIVCYSYTRPYILSRSLHYPSVHKDREGSQLLMPQFHPWSCSNLTIRMSNQRQSRSADDMSKVIYASPAANE